MYYEDHNPPHFHVRYNTYKGAVAIHDLKLVAGRLPPNVLSLVLDWADRHQMELLVNWELAKQHAPLNLIVPLE